jgi:large subunit ribosomal protein L11
MEIKSQLDIYILAQGADAAPPLGTVLGNLGVNSITFCKDFNTATADLPNYFTLSVRILVFSNKSYKFSIEGLPLSPLLNLLAFERKALVKSKSILQRCISKQNAIQLAMFALPQLPLEKSFPIILGTVKACGLTVVK